MVGMGINQEPPRTNVWQRQELISGLEPPHLLPRTMNKPLPRFLQQLRNEMKLASEVKANSVRQGAGEEYPKLQRLQPQPVTIIRDVPRVPTVVERHGAHRLEGEGMRDHCGRKLHSICQPWTALTDCAGTSVASFHPDKNKRQKKPRTRRVKAQEEHVR